MGRMGIGEKRGGRFVVGWIVFVLGMGIVFGLVCVYYWLLL
jgi:hypothetical protein